MAILWNNPDRINRSAQEATLLEQSENSAQEDHLTGSLFEGRFQVLAVIGLGGMGKVYKARHIHMNKTVAIKTLASNTVFDDNSFLRFEQEARTASSLSHPNIINIFDFGKSDLGFAYLVMEFVDGKTLEEIIVETDCIPPERFLRIFTQVCDGMQHAHKKGIIHRDLKPSNLMISDEDEQVDLVRIVDFGLAKLADADPSQQLTQAGLVMGSPLFMSPEQCKGEELDFRSDIYSLGCVMYAALTGHLPLKGKNSMATMYKHISDTPPTLSQIAPELNFPPLLEHTVMRTLQKDPSLRPQSMAELSALIQDSIRNPHKFVVPATNTVEASPAKDKSAESSGSENESAAVFGSKAPINQVHEKESRERATGENEEIREKQLKNEQVGDNSLGSSAFLTGLLSISIIVLVILGVFASSSSHKSPRSSRPTNSPRRSYTPAGITALPQPIEKEAPRSAEKSAVPQASSIKNNSDNKILDMGSQTNHESARTTKVKFSVGSVEEPKSDSSKGTGRIKQAVPDRKTGPSNASKMEEKLADKDESVSIKAELRDEKAQAEKLSKQFANQAHAAYKAGSFVKAKFLLEKELEQEEIAYGKYNPRLLTSISHLITCKRKLGEAPAEQLLDYSLRCMSQDKDSAIKYVEGLSTAQSVWSTLALESLDMARISAGPRRKSYADWSCFFFNLLSQQSDQDKNPEYFKLKNAAAQARKISNEFPSSEFLRKGPGFRRPVSQFSAPVPARGAARQKLDSLRRRFRMQDQ